MRPIGDWDTGLQHVLAKHPSFNRASNLCNMIENNLPGMGGPDWFCQKINPDDFPDAKHEDLVLWLRNLEDCADYLIGRPDLSGEIIFSPEVIFADDDQIQIINEMPTGQRWHEILVCASPLVPKVHPIILTGL
ncbi:unnamed protein product [Rhizoctonia solani]|uniref:Uncharacterized protein n=1 Tax=Rhizoctonia solani TaxID=456999 RepID=A0A8H3CBL3_9AGAM|nr:unnamed protein product [Rhizoctonia solani]